jgi:superfamily II DNA/RNA helicase
MSTQSFLDLGTSEAVATTLAARGITTPFPIQDLVLRDALAGRDIMAKSRTGSGKTIAFAIPIVERIRPSDRRPSALILVPTRELAAQVVGEFEDIAKAKKLHAGWFGSTTFGS